METEELAISMLEHAPWNPRKPEELAHDNPEIIKLAQSLKENGQLHPIGVWLRSGPNESDLVIYGNRRLEAAKLAGWRNINAVVYADLTEAEAQAKTREENENRLGVDPMQDSVLINRMVRQGKSQKQIAEETGLSEAMVCRRMKLVDLDADELGKIVDLKKFDTKSLELIAAQPKQLQLKIANEIKGYCGWNDTIKFSSVRGVFERITATIDESSWMFKCGGGAERLARCRCCGMCTGNQPTLFDDADGDFYTPHGMSRCLDVACFKKMSKEAKKDCVDEAIAAAGGDSAGRKEEHNQYWGPISDLKAKKWSKRTPFCHFYFDESTGKVIIKYGQDPKVSEAAEKRRREDEKAAQMQADAERRTLSGAIMKIREYLLELDENKRPHRLRECMQKNFDWLDDKFAALEEIFVEFECSWENASEDYLDDGEAGSELMRTLFRPDCDSVRRADIVSRLWYEWFNQSIDTGYRSKPEIIVSMVNNLAIAISCGLAPDEIAAIEKAAKSEG